MSQGGYPPLKPPTRGDREQKKILEKIFFVNFFFGNLYINMTHLYKSRGVPPLETPH